MSALPELPADDATTAGLLIAEGLCPHCGEPLAPWWVLGLSSPPAVGRGVCEDCQLCWRVRSITLPSGLRAVEIEGGHFVDLP